MLHDQRKLEIDLLDFVLRGHFPSVRRGTHRDEIVKLLGPPDQPSYPSHVVYGNVCFETEYAFGKVDYVQILLLHESLLYCADPAWLPRWKPPYWLDSWPDSRFLWKLGPFKTGMTLTQVQESIPELRSIEPEFPLWEAYGASFVLRTPVSQVGLKFESLQRGKECTLAKIIGQPSI